MKAGGLLVWAWLCLLAGVALVVAYPPLFIISAFLVVSGVNKFYRYSHERLGMFPMPEKPEPPEEPKLSALDEPWYNYYDNDEEDEDA